MPTDQSRHTHQERTEEMARIIVTIDQGGYPGVPVLLDELVCSDHLSDDHAAAQLIQRLGWAVTDAEDAQHLHRAT